VLPENPQLLPTQDVPGTDGGICAACEGCVAGHVQHQAQHCSCVAPQCLVTAATGHLPHLGRSICAAGHQEPPCASSLQAGSTREVLRGGIGQGQHAVVVATKLPGHLPLVHSPDACCPVVGAAEELVISNQDPASKRGRNRAATLRMSESTVPMR
jgi:hypothetical protein